MIAEIESTLNPVGATPGRAVQATVLTGLRPACIGVKKGTTEQCSEALHSPPAGFRGQASTISSGDSVSNAGDANCEIQAGLRNATLLPSLLVVEEAAAGVNAPLSQSSLSVARCGATDTERGLIDAAPGEDRCSALISGDGALGTARPTNDFAQVAGMLPEENSGTALGLPANGKSEPHETRACADFGRAKGEGRNAKGEAEAEEEQEVELKELCDGGVGRPPDDWRIQEANRRQGILEEFQLLLGRGHEGRAPMSKKQAAAAVGQGHVTIYRWQKRFAKLGFNGLLPETEKCGRKTIWETLGFTKEQFDAIMQEVRGLNLDLQSVTASLRAFANSDKCPPDLARVILDPKRCSKHALPPSLRKAVQIGSGIFGRDGKKDPLHLAHRGPRALSLKGAWTPRKLDILPGDIFSSDDTTPIWGYTVPWIESEEYPYGVKLVQGQFLPVMDVGGQAIIAKGLIARETSSYRASDIWSLFGHTFSTVGLPRLGFQLERGSWESNLIRGQEVHYREREVSMSRRVGGLRQLPTNITQWHREQWLKKNPEAKEFPFPKTLQTWTSYLPKSKSIEAFFQRCQTFEGTLWGCLGRDQMRAPFEKTKKIYEACRRGTADPRLHFLSQEELVKRLNGILSYINEEPMEGEVFKGVPIQNFEQAVKEYPLFHVEPEMQWLYRRDWSVVQVTGYFVRVRLTDPMSGERYSLFYANPEVFAQHSGEEVAVYYDRENFEQPAQIILARTGEFLCEATYEDRKGSFLGGDQSGHDMRKRWKNAVMSVYSTLVKHSPSRQVPVEIAARRQEAKAAARQVDGRELRVESQKTETTAGTVTVDGRPAAAVLQPSRSAEQIEKQRNRLSQQAAIAQKLRALRGEE